MADSCLYQRWESDRRYYVIYLARGLFGWTLTKAWGGLNSALGRITQTSCSSFDDGISKIVLISKQRLNHDYHLTLEKRYYASGKSCIRSYAGSKRGQLRL